MREGVIPDLVLFGEDPLDQPWVALGILSDEEERSFHVQLLQLIEDLRRIERGWPVVDRQCDPLLVVPAPADDVGSRKGVVRLVESKTGVLVDLQRARAFGGRRVDIGYLAVADELAVIREADLV